MAVRLSKEFSPRCMIEERQNELLPLSFPLLQSRKSYLSSIDHLYEEKPEDYYIHSSQLLFHSYLSPAREREQYATE